MIHNNIRLVLDLTMEDDGFILFLDVYKAFDIVEHVFVLFGFGDTLVNMIKIMYNYINSSVTLPTGTSPQFYIRCGICQGSSNFIPHGG